MAIQVDVSANQRALIDSINRGVNAYNKRFAKSNSIDLKINERSFTQPLGRITGSVDDFGAAMAASNARVIAFGASTAVLGTAVAGFRSLAKATIEVEKNLTDVNRILQLSTSDLQTFGKELFNISKRTATSFNDASKALLEFSRQGLDASETLRRTNDALTLTRLAGLGAEASVAALTATVNGFSKSGLTTTQVLNKLVAVEQSFAVSARDLSEGLARTGQAAQEAGINIDQLNALISAAQQRTARGGAVIGNALKTIFTRLQRSDTLDRLEEFNIAVRDVQGNTLPAAAVLQNFANAYDRLADAQRSQLSEQVAGVYQVNILKAIISDLNSEQSVYTAALEKGARASNEAERANAQLNQSLSALLVQVGTNTQQLASQIGSVTFDPLAKSAAKAANSILETFTDLLTGEGFGSDLANGLLKGIRNVLGGPGAVAAFYTLFKLVQNSFTYVAQALPQLAGITTETQKRQNLEQAILSILQQESQVQKALIGSTGNQKRQAEILLGVARQQTAEYVKQKSIAASLSGTLRAQGVTIGARGLQAGNPKTRSGGYIPPSARKAEKAGALAGGYTPGAVVNSPVGGVMNTAENVKYIPGFAQPFINPPKQSRAGRLHKINALRQVGVDPYQYGGFVPNFAKSKMAVNFQRGRSFEQVVGNMIGAEPEYNAPIDYKRVNRVPRGHGFNREMYKKGPYADAHVGLGHTAAQIISKILNHHADNKIGLDIFEQDGNILLGSNFVEIIGKGADVKGQIKTSKYSSLNTTAKNNYSEYEGRTFRTAFDKDKVKIPNFAAAYRNIFTGELNNSAIARGLRSGDLTPQQASAMGYRTSDSKISDRKAKRAASVNALNYTMAYIPWDVEKFRGGRSGGKLNIAQGDAYEKYVLGLIGSGRLKGTSALGQPFSLGARPDVRSNEGLKGGRNARIDGYSLSAGEMYEIKSGDLGDSLAGVQTKFIKALENNPQTLNPERKWKNFVFRTTAAKGRGASGGFIPNLAYKSEVMDLEEFISGQKAIYSNKPFPHVRNANQPTFASAIADHGGLSNALKDSYMNQSAAGLVSGGYVPNFAPQYQTSRDYGGLGLGAINLTAQAQQNLNTEIKNLIQSYKDGNITRKNLTASTKKLIQENNLTKESGKRLRKNVNARARSVEKLAKQESKPGLLGRAGGKLQGASTALAFAGPMIAGLVEQAAFGNRERINMSGAERATQSVLSTGLTTASTAFSIGSQFGTPGLVVAGLATAAVTAASAIGAMSLSTEEYTQVLNNYNTKTQETTSAAQKYIAAQESLSKAISSEDIKTASEALKDNFKDIKNVNLQKAFKDAGGDVTELTKALKTYENERAAGASRRQQAIFASQLNEVKSGTGITGKTEQARQLEALGIETASGSEGSGRRKVATLDLTDSGRKAVINQFSQLFEDVSSLTEEQIDVLSKALKEEADSGYFSASRISSILQEGGLSLGVSALNAEVFDQLEEAGNLPGRTLVRNFEEFFKLYTAQAEAANIDQKAKEAAAEAKKASTETFNQIVRNIEQGFVSFRQEAELAFQRSSSELKIEATVTEFARSLNEQLNSFILGNLPDLEKGQFSQFAAEQKATDQLIKLRQDRASFELNQEKEKNDLLMSNAESLSKTFSSEIFQSEETGKAFRDLVLPKIQQGDYNVTDLFNTFTREQNKKAIQEFNESAPELLGRTFKYEGKSEDQVKGTFGMFQRDISSRIRRIEDGDANTVGSSPDTIERLRDLNDVLITIRDTSGAVLGDLTKEQEAKIKAAIVDKENALEQLELKQELAREELALNEEISRQRINAEKTIAVEKAAIDTANLRRTQAAASASARLGFSQDLSAATGDSRIAGIQRNLDDPRQTFGMGLKEINERRIAAEKEILEQRRAIEDNQLQIEMQQSMLRLSAEIENTNALKQLNSTVLDLIGVQLSDDAGVKAISEFRKQNAGSESLDSDVNSLFSTQDIGRYNALQRINAIQASSGAGSSELTKALSQNSDLNFDSLRSTAKGNEALLEQINLLEEQYDTRLKILGIQRGAENKDIAQQAELTRMNNTLSGRFERGVGAMRAESDQILLNLAETAPSRFADGMANALSEVAQGTKSLGDAFTDMAIDFGRMLQQEVFRAIAQRAIGSVLSGGFGFSGGSQKGGIIKAQNGMYISGGRTGDRNLAMLEDGEYVLNRNAVRMMGGPKSLDNLNFAMAPRFNRGGGFSMGAGLDNNRNFDDTLLINDANTGKIDASMFSAFAYENSPYFQDVRQRAEKRMQRKIQKRFEKQQKRAQLISSIVGMAGSMFMGAGLSGMGGNPAPKGTKTVMNLDGTMSSVAPGTPTYLSRYASAPAPGFLGRNSGGFIPHGSRLNDTIPAMLTGGEYVMNNKAVKKYGLGTMNSMNFGSYQGGGTANSNTTNNRTNNNSTNVSVNIDRSGNAVYGSDTTSYEQQDIVISKKMAREISGIVLKNISNEKRYGGELHGK